VFYKLRNNEPSVNFRYLQIRKNPEEKKMYTLLYEERKEVFDKYEQLILQIAKYIHSSYMRRFIKKQYVRVDPDYYRVMMQCHTWHQLDMKNNIVTFDRVIQQMNEQFPVQLNRMIKKMKQFNKERETQFVY
jgi:hypothetical protein